MNISRSFLLVVASLSVGGCGTYNQVVQMLPESGDGWIKPGLGALDREYKCDGSSLIVSRPLVQSTKVARAFFWIPLPGTAESKSVGSISEPLLISISIGPIQNFGSCASDLVWIKNQNIAGDIFSSGVENERHNRINGFHFCTYKFPPIDRIGNEFRLYFSPKMLTCEVTPLHFRREDTTTYFPAFVP